MKKKLLIIVIVMLLCLLYLSLFPVKWSIDRECKAYLLTTNNTMETKELSVRIKGEYKFYLFSSDTFTGTFEIEGFPETLDNVILKLDHGVADLVYHRWDGFKLYSTSFGMISTDFNLKNFVILKGDASGWIDLGGNILNAIISENMNISDIEAFQEKLLEKN